MTTVLLSPGGGLPAYVAGTSRVATGVRANEGARVHMVVPAWEVRFPDDALTYSRAGAGLRPERTGLRLDLFV